MYAEQHYLRRLTEVDGASPRCYHLEHDDSISKRDPGATAVIIACYYCDHASASFEEAATHVEADHQREEQLHAAMDLGIEVDDDVEQE